MMFLFKYKKNSSGVSKPDMFDYRMGTHNYYIITMKRHYWYETSSTTMNHHWPVFIITIITIITNHHYEKSLAMIIHAEPRAEPFLKSQEPIPGQRWNFSRIVWQSCSSVWADPRAARIFSQAQWKSTSRGLRGEPPMGSRWSKLRTLTWHKVNSMIFLGHIHFMERILGG